MTDLFYQTNQTYILENFFQFCKAKYGVTPDLDYWKDNFFGYAEGRKRGGGGREMGDGRWEMGDGRWEMGDGSWELGDGRGGRSQRGNGDVKEGSADILL